MPSAAEARSRWEETRRNCSTLADLQRAVRYGGPDSPAVRGCRSLCWKIFLLFHDVSTAAWLHTLHETRASYAESRDHLLKFIKHPESLASLSSDPLTDDPDSPWNSARQDEVIRAEIAQDVRRLPDEPFYHQERIQTMIIDILFVYCKLNSAAGGYRQGMHELLAPIVYVVEHDAVDGAAEVTSNSDSDGLMVKVLDPSFVEHDAFALFSRIMDQAASFYEINETGTSTLPEAHDSGSSVIVEKSRFIHEVCLNKVDPELSRHLTNIEILPQIFLIRWIRLLFGREFPADELLVFWDALFAVDSRLELVDYICVAMLLRIRWELLEADYSVCLQLLLKYPTPAPPHGPHTFVDDALYLRDHLDPSGATPLLMKYTGKVPSSALKDPTPNALVRTAPNSRIPGSLRGRASTSRVSLATRLTQQPGSVEALLQVAAKNVFQRSEKLGINQAVREAMGEIRRNVQSLQDTRSQPSGVAPDPVVPASSNVGSSDQAASAMERRNRRLAAMLEEGLVGLKAITADDLDDKAKSLEMIEIAAEKVELVKTYLEDPSAEFPEAGRARSAGGEADVVMEPAPDAEAESKAEGAGGPLKEPDAVVSDPVRAISSLSLSDRGAKPPQPAASTSCPEPRPTPSSTRPSIAQSSFAWMLDEPSDDTDTGPSTSDARPSPMSPRRTNVNKKNAFLFGEVVPPGDEGNGEGEIFGLDGVKRSEKSLFG